MSALSINWGDVGKVAPEVVPTTPYWELDQDNMTKAIEGLGDIVGYFNRKDLLKKDPKLEGLKSKLKELIAKKESLQSRIAELEKDNQGLYNDTTKRSDFIQKQSLGMKDYNPSNVDDGLDFGNLGQRQVKNDTYNTDEYKKAMGELFNTALDYKPNVAPTYKKDPTRTRGY